MNSTCTADRCETCPARVVCKCLRVTEQEVVTVVATLGLRSVVDVRDVTGAGDGCTCCHDEIRQILDASNSFATAQ